MKIFSSIASECLSYVIYYILISAEPYWMKKRVFTQFLKYGFCIATISMPMERSKDDIPGFRLCEKGEKW